MTDDVGSHRRGSLLQGRRGSTLHGQLSTSSESSSSSSSERRRSSCLSDVSVRSGSSKRSSTGDFSSELDDYFDSVAHRSLQTAVIVEEDHDAAQSSAASQPPTAAVAGQHLLEHFVDNLMNEAAQQCKAELDRFLTGGAAASRLEQFADRLAGRLVTAGVHEALETQPSNWTDVTGSVERRAADQQQHAAGRRRIERQQTVSGFRDALLSDFDKKLISSNVTDDVGAVQDDVGAVRTSTSSGRTRRASEPAYLITRTTAPPPPPPLPSPPPASSVNCREVISSWFVSEQRVAPVDHVTQFVDGLLLDAFVHAVSTLSMLVRRGGGRRHVPSSRDRVTSRDAVPDVIWSYADRVTSGILRAVRRELSAGAAWSASAAWSAGAAWSAHVQSVADKFATSIVDDVLGLRSTTTAPLLVSQQHHRTLCLSVICASNRP